MRSYQSPASGASPTLPVLIEQLQNIHLFAEQQTARDYATHRQVEELTQNLADMIGRLDKRILEATSPISYE